MSTFAHTESALRNAQVQIADHARDRDEAFQALAASFGDSPEAAQRICAAFQAREQLASTHVGEGVAIPHARLEGLGAPRLSVMILRDGVDYGDGSERVRILAGLLGDECEPRTHLQMLQRLACALTRPEVRAQLVNATDASEVLAALCNPTAQVAAA